MLKKATSLILSGIMAFSACTLSFPFEALGSADAKTAAYEAKIKSFNPEYVMWTDNMMENVDENFANMSPNASSKTNTTIQDPYANDGTVYTDWEYYEFLWTHGYPVGNGRMAAVVMGGIDKEVIQINEDTVWTGSPYKDLTTNEPTSGTKKDSWKYYRGANADGSPAEIGSADAIVGDEAFRSTYPEYANQSIANKSLNVSNAKELSAVQDRYSLESLIEKYFLGSPTRQKAYQSFVENYLDFGQNYKNATNYTKSLNMSNGIVTVDYDYGNAHYTRETLASYPSQTVATNIKSEGEELNFKSQLHTYLLDENLVEGGKFEKVSDNQVKLTARVKDGKSNEPGGLSAIKVEARMYVNAPNSTLEVSDDCSTITIKGGNEATIYVVGATNYVDYLTLDDSKPAKDCESYMKKVEGKTYEQIKGAHVEDFKELYNRTNLTLKNNSAFDAYGIPTEKRVRKDVNGKSAFKIGAGSKLSAANSAKVYSTYNDGDNSLVTLDFNYGKYLMISGSRDKSSGIPMSQPLNLTGKWNPSLNPSWSGKYTININTEMNYWLAQPLNLAECEKPLLDTFADLAKSGSITARECYAITNSRGDDSYKPGDPWVMHHNYDLWKGTQPIDNATAGVWPTGGIWLLDHAWQYYKYNLDEEYLAEFYPLMKGAADFFTQFLVVDPQTGYLVTAASVSPEQGSVQPGPAMDTQLIRNLYYSVLEAAKVLGKETEDAALLTKIKEQLPQNGYFSNEAGKIAPNLVDKTGLIQEWVRGDVGFDLSSSDKKGIWTVTNPFTGATEKVYDHVASNNTGHRHCSHLWELYPGTHLSGYSKDENEQAIFKAYQKSVGARGAGSGQGWGVAWRIALSARALDGDTAASRIEQLFRTRTSPNLFDQHPNFQIDGNYGMTAGVTEMLMQSHDGVITLLPALPSTWKEGKFEGFKARGNIEVGAKWKKGTLSRATIKAIDGGEVKVRNPYVGAAGVKDSQGNLVENTLEDNNTILVFNAEPGEEYTITGFGEAAKSDGLVEEKWEKVASDATDFVGGSQIPKYETSNNNIGYIYSDGNGNEVSFCYPNCKMDSLKQLSLSTYAKYGEGVQLSVRLDSKDGIEIATLEVPKSGAYITSDLTLNTENLKGVTGNHNLYLVFSWPSNTKPSYMANVKELTGVCEINYVNKNIIKISKGGSSYDKNILVEGDYAVNVDFEYLDGVQKARAVVGFYDDNEKLIYSTDKEVTPSDNTINVSVTNELAKYNMKLMVWNDYNNMNPLCASKELVK